MNVRDILGQSCSWCHYLVLREQGIRTLEFGSRRFQGRSGVQDCDAAIEWAYSSVSVRAHA